MPTTRKKVIKTVYKDEDESDAGDFSDSGSEAHISEQSSDEDEECDLSSGDEFQENKKNKHKSVKKIAGKSQFAKSFINKINKQISASESDNILEVPVLFSVKDLTEADKLLPSVLNLSESDSSDDESPKPTVQQNLSTLSASSTNQTHDSDSDKETEYKDVWSKNVQDSEEIAIKTFMQLQEHKNKLEETKKSVQQYTTKGVVEASHESDVKDLLALGEEVVPRSIPTLIKKRTKHSKKDDSDSDVGDWEEVNEAKSIPQQGLQLLVELPGGVCRKSKKLDVEMMMKRKINRVKKEYQVYMHKVHVLSWIAHGNYVSRVLNDQDILAAALLLVPSKDCYPGERVDMKYLEQITTWYKDKLTLKQDKNEDKFKPKAPPLKDILLKQMKAKTVSSKKNLVLVFISILRALGLQCRLMLNFVTLPLKPPSSELCSLSTKAKDEHGRARNKSNSDTKEIKKGTKSNVKKSKKLAQIDGNYDSDISDITQLDGSDDVIAKTRNTRSNRNKEESAKLESASQQPSRRNKSPKPEANVDKLQDNGVPSKRIRKAPQTSNKTLAIKNDENDGQDDVVPPKRPRRIPSPRPKKSLKSETDVKVDVSPPKKAKLRSTNEIESDQLLFNSENANHLETKTTTSELKTTKLNETKQVKPTMASKTSAGNPSNNKNTNKSESVRPKKSTTTKKEKVIESTNTKSKAKQSTPPQIIITKDPCSETSKYFTEPTTSSRVRSSSVNPNTLKSLDKNPKTRTKSAPGSSVEKSKYFDDNNSTATSRSTRRKVPSKEDQLRVSHRDLAKISPRGKSKVDVTGDLRDIIRSRVKEAKEDTKRKLVKGVKFKEEIVDDSDYLPEEPSSRKSVSDDDFKSTKISPGPKASTSRKIDRRVLSSEDESVQKNKCDVWCEVYVEELEQWISVDVIKARVHCVNEIYRGLSHPVCYIVGWDNNNHLKDVTRRYVPQWNTVTRKLRADSQWWDKAVKAWLGPRTARDREEDESLDRLQIEAPLPKSISEYKNHPLYALQRHLLKFEAIYPPDTATLGFVRKEPVYPRDSVYTCKSRTTWLKEAKVVRLGEDPYKIVKARPRWDKLSNRIITEYKPLEIFGPWQVTDYEPPTAENGIVPRNEYGNVELFKECMLPKGTVLIKLPGVNKVARNLNIDCAPAMTGFDSNGGWVHPIYDGFVVCKEFEEVITEAWLKDQEERERRELERTESRVYGNWRRLIRGLLIRERLKDKYGFENEQDPDKDKKKTKGPRFVAKKK